MLGVRYLGTFSENSGYAQACRTYITALYLAGIDVTTELIVQMVDRSHDYGWMGRLSTQLKDRKIDYKVKFLHITPDLYPGYMEKDKYNIGHLFWETDRLPKEWANPCNKVNEIWTLSEEQARMIKNSGVTVPIKWFPQPIDISLAELNLTPFIVPNFDGFIFYSIFQFILRKNPEALIKTYLKTFEGKDDVCLVLKTYGVTYSDKEFIKIKDEIAKWKKELNQAHYPKIFLIDKVMTTDELFRTHLMGDVYVNTSCGEGNGIPVVEAALMGKPIISTDTTGFADYFPKDIYYPIPAQAVQAIQTPSIPWYTSEMKWLDIDRQKLSEAMLNVYNNQKEAKERGLKAQEFVKKEFNFWKIGEAMRLRLEEISKFI